MKKYQRDVALIILQAMVEIPECRFGMGGRSGEEIATHMGMGIGSVGGVFGSTVNSLLDRLAKRGLVQTPFNSRKTLWTFTDDPMVVIGKVMVLQTSERGSGSFPAARPATTGDAGREGPAAKTPYVGENHDSSSREQRSPSPPSHA